MFLVHLSELKKQGVPDKETPAAAKKSSTKEEITKKGTELIFEFYDKLKEEQVSIPDYETPEEKAAQATHHYYLQVASFRRNEDADKARARLILLNMDAAIEKSTLQSGADVYRVIVGPYQSKSKLAKARQTLVSNGFEFLTLKRKI